MNPNEIVKDPWTYINPADAATYPARFTGVFFAVRIGNVDTIIAGHYDDLGRVFVDSETRHAIPGIVYAYLSPHYMDPPPFPGTTETQDATP